MMQSSPAADCSQAGILAATARCNPHTHHHHHHPYTYTHKHINSFRKCMSRTKIYTFIVTTQDDSQIQATTFTIMSHSQNYVDIYCFYLFHINLCVISFVITILCLCIYLIVSIINLFCQLRILNQYCMTPPCMPFLLFSP